MFGPPEERNVNASPQAGQGGPSTAGAVAFQEWSVPASAALDGSRFGMPPSVAAAPPPWRIVSWWPQEPQLPVSTVAGRASYSIAVPQSGQARVMFVRPGTVVGTSLQRAPPQFPDSDRAAGRPRENFLVEREGLDSSEHEVHRIPAPPRDSTKCHK
jgi:hypothetical protein